MFDGEPSAQPYGNLGPKDVCTPAHQELAHEAAIQGIVLLKNQGPSLPLSARSHRTVAVIGPNSDVNVTMIGNYAGTYVHTAFRTRCSSKNVPSNSVELLRNYVDTRITFL